MATIVRNTKSGERYVLLGSGFGSYQSKKPNWFFGDLVSDTTEGQHAMICVCDSAGQIGWLESQHVLVESVDGQNVANLF